MTVTEFAKLLGISQQSASKGLTAGRLPERLLRRDARGRIVEVLDAKQARLAWEASAQVARPVGAGDRETMAKWREARARREVARARLAELEFSERSGEFVRAADVEAKLTTCITNCRNRLLAIPSQARQQAPELTASQIQLLDGLIREALEELAGAKEEVSDHGSP